MSEPATESAGGDDIVAGLSEHERCQLLADDERRAVLDALGSPPLSVALEPLARAITAQRTGTDAPDDA